MSFRFSTFSRVVIFMAIALAVAYFGVLRPLGQRVIEADTPLNELRGRLSRAMVEAGLPSGTDIPTLTGYLDRLRSASSAFTSAERDARPRLEQPPEVRRRLDQPFQLVEFLNESQRRLEELAALAQSGQVAVTPGLSLGFPRYQPELVRPELLWVQLATVTRLVRTAIRAGVRDVTEVSVEALPVVEPADPGAAVPPSFAPTPPLTNGGWSTLRVHMTTSGNVDALCKLLVALALTPEELKKAGLPETLGARPALFIEHLFLRRTELEAAEQARLDLVVSTVVPNESL